jgi:arylsulfatase A-like enzyme
MTEQRPNIVFILNDHQAYYRHGWDGGVRPQTPNYDRLAAGGVHFDRSYCAAPLCGPTRRTLLTGLFPHNHKQHHNYTDPPYDHEVYLNLLSDQGYRNFYYGKWHAGPGSALDHNCEGFSYHDYGNPYITPEYGDYLERYDLPPAEHLIERVFTVEGFDEMFPKLKVGEKYRCEANWCGEHAIGVTTTPKETHESFFLANLACEKLTKLSQSTDDNPFHLRVDFWGPHQPHFPTKEFTDLYNPEEIEVYGNFNSDLKNKPARYHRERNHPISKDDQIIFPNPLPWEEWQKVLARAYAHISMVDAAGGMILDKLEELGLAENTVVLWALDHGDGVACHGGHFDKSSYMPEEMVRTYLALRYPGQVKAGRVLPHLISHVDIPPTILDLAGTQFNETVDGTSLLDICKDENTDWREDLLVETFGHGWGDEDLGKMIVTDQYKFIANEGQMNELYDLDADPYELDNLIDNPDFKEVQKNMIERLVVWMADTGDKADINDLL